MNWSLLKLHGDLETLLDKAITSYLILSTFQHLNMPDSKLSKILTNFYGKPSSICEPFCKPSIWARVSGNNSNSNPSLITYLYFSENISNKTQDSTKNIFGKFCIVFFSLFLCLQSSSSNDPHHLTKTLEKCTHVRECIHSNVYRTSVVTKK